MSAKYDIIGCTYAELRKPDHRIAAVIANALGSARTVLNVGVGTGSYEPADRSLIAVEPSRGMIRKRSPAAAEAISGASRLQRWIPQLAEANRSTNGRIGPSGHPPYEG